ncbi:MAG: response regulator transcription factor [Microbacteriaceae bacterium]
MIRLALVDDHKLLLSGLSAWIRDAADDIELAIIATSWPELLTHPNFPVDIVLLDLDLKDQIPITLKISMLNTAKVKTVLMSAYSNPTLVREGLQAGALGYLVKSEDAADMVAAIRGAMRGQSYISSELQNSLSETGITPRLAEQERKVMAMYANGKPIKNIAFELNITEETTKSYLKRLREKYRNAGIDIGTKVSLRKQAILDGIILPEN